MRVLKKLSSSPPSRAVVQSVPESIITRRWKARRHASSKPRKSPFQNISFHFIILSDESSSPRMMQFFPETSSRAVWPSKRPQLRFERRKERKKSPSFVFVLSREDRTLFSRPFSRAKIINLLFTRRFVLRVLKGYFSRAKSRLHFEKTPFGFLTKKTRSLDWP